MGLKTRIPFMLLIKKGGYNCTWYTCIQWCRLHEEIMCVLWSSSGPCFLLLCTINDFHLLLWCSIVLVVVGIRFLHHRGQDEIWNLTLRNHYLVEYGVIYILFLFESQEVSIGAACQKVRAFLFVILEGARSLIWWIRMWLVVDFFMVKDLPLN